MSEETQVAARLLMPRREVWLDIPDYPGFKIKLWANPPRGLVVDIYSEDEGRLEAALHQLVLEHNGWCDHEGQPLPAAGEPAFWEAVPTELATVVILLIDKAATVLPNSMAAKRRR